MKLLIDALGVCLLLILAVTTIVHLLALIQSVRAENRRWKQEAETHEKRNAARQRFLQEMRERHRQEVGWRS